MRYRLFLTAVICTPLFLTSCASTYLGRYLSWGSINGPEMQDKFPTREISSGTGEAFPFNQPDNAAKKAEALLSEIEYRDSELERKVLPFNDFMAATETACFIVIQDDAVLFEKYAEGYDRTSIMPSFSMSKSITALLIGCAIDDGSIGSEEDPISYYLPEYEDEKFRDIRIKHLLGMNSGFKHSFGFAPWNDFVKSYFDPNLRKVALRQKVKHSPGKRFNYNNSNTQLLGIILERATGMSPSLYLSKKIWSKIGTEAPAYWSIDSEKYGFEQMASGFYARPLDYARLGRLVLNEGAWEGTQLVPADWVRNSTTADLVYGNPAEYYQADPEDEDNYFVDFFFERNGYYAYQWWGIRDTAAGTMVLASGMYGQYIAIVPEKNLLILRFGDDPGEIFSWADVFVDIAEGM